ncbi:MULTISPECIES: LPS export ABC transporter permease LptF [unclassified Idiomarina]|uniref:LPS export ABC transporter permease LptF n=1 Tax=unclassified Idiomarina TaxID=2614829 RepID=UPI000C958B29|nr:MULTISPECIES: LPS export ABC transporter permease LptF [unclassified Idiomarina]MAD53423.1 LPS export ABC transporter permease LptF [Idiomarinaceae bacterium]MEC7642744.1 LPS export ABC transporter permease LptF [Pseudomonadota bacterium]NQZ05088.1 LPS export ABC transporter permease LptF [Idiomarina sp.]
MRIFKYLIAETLKSQIAVLVVLMTIFVSQKFVRVLSDASEGDIPSSIIFQLLSLNLPALLALIIPLSLFLGILLAHGRIYADNEMTVLHACGVSEWYVTRVTLVVAVMLALLTAALTMYVVPWSLEQEQKIEDKARADSGLTALIPGRFQQSSNGKAVIFIQSQDEQGDLQNVFVAQHQAEQGRIRSGSVVVSTSGEVNTESSGSQWLELRDGKRFAGDGEHYQLMSFEQYRLQIKEQPVDEQLRDLEAYTVNELWQEQSNAAAAELQWRIAIPLAMPLLTLIAVPLSRVNPRQGKFARMAPAILIYLGYFLVLMAAKSAVRDGVIPTYIGLWWIHVALLVFGIALLSRARPVGLKFWAHLMFWRQRSRGV